MSRNFPTGRRGNSISATIFIGGRNFPFQLLAMKIRRGATCGRGNSTRGTSQCDLTKRELSSASSVARPVKQAGAIPRELSKQRPESANIISSHGWLEKNNKSGSHVRHFGRHAWPRVKRSQSIPPGGTVPPLSLSLSVHRGARFERSHRRPRVTETTKMPWRFPKGETDQIHPPSYK